MNSGAEDHRETDRVVENPLFQQRLPTRKQMDESSCQQRSHLSVIANRQNVS